MFSQIPPILAWRQLNGKKKNIKDAFTDEEMLEYVQSVYMHEEVSPMVEAEMKRC